jgi:hypothetical protein
MGLDHFMHFDDKLSDWFGILIENVLGIDEALEFSFKVLKDSVHNQIHLLLLEDLFLLCWIRVGSPALEELLQVFWFVG